MFMGPLDADVTWSTTGLDGSRRFLDRAWRVVVDTDDTLSTKLNDDSNELEKNYLEKVRKVTHDVINIHFKCGNYLIILIILEDFYIIYITYYNINYK